MAQIDRIVQVFITRQTTQIDIASFDKPLILTEIDTDVITFPERVRTYTSLEGVADDLGITHPAYIAAQKLLSQQLKPTEFRIGKKDIAEDSDETWTEALLEAANADNSWYALIATTHDPVQVEALSDAIQAMRKIYGTSTQSADALVGSITTDIGSVLEAKGNDRTFVLYSATADTQYPEAAWIGGQLPEIPGSNTWEYKTLAGVTAAPLSDSNITVLEAKGYNYYTEIKGASVTRRGVMAGGTWIDEIIFVDWLHARIQEQIFFRLINRKKVPYTRAGATVIEAEIRSVLAQGVVNGGIADDTPVVVRSPDPLNIPEMIRATRTMGDFTFEARLAGAVSVVVVRGTVGV